MSVLLLNFLLYAVWFIIEFIKERRITIYSFFIIYYVIIAFIGYYTVEMSNIYIDTFGKVYVKELEIEPYLYCFISNFILFSPLKGLQYRSNNIKSIFTNKTQLLVRVWIIYSVLYLLLKLIEAIAALSLGLDNMYNMRHIDGDTLFVYDNSIIKYFNFAGLFISSGMTPFIMLYSILGGYCKQISTSFSMLLIGLAFAPELLNNIAMGSRGGIFMTFFCLLFFIIVLYHFIPKQMLKRFYVIISLFLGASLVYSWMITLARFDKSTNGLDSILRYFGEPFPNLGFSFWDKVSRHPMGDRLFPILTNNNTSLASAGEIHKYWYNYTGVPIHTFKTVFGDLYIEYGTVLSLVFILILSFCFRLFIKKKAITIVNLPIIYFYIQLCVFSLAGFAKKWNENTILQIVMIVMYIIFIKYIIKPKSNELGVK